MTFNDNYFNYIKNRLDDLTPMGYKMVVEREVSFDATISEYDNTIVCVVRFGVASKRTNDQTTIIQPIILSVYTEARSVDISQNIFTNFFLTESRINHTITVEDEDYHIMPTYNSPVVQPGMNTVKGAKRGFLLMTGVISYSVNNVFGVKYYLDNQEIYTINPQTQYSTNPITPNYLGGSGGLLIEGSNNSITLIIPLIKNPTLYKLLDLAIEGETSTNNTQYDLRIVYPIKTYSLRVQVTAVSNMYVTESGDSTLTATFMPVGE